MNILIAPENDKCDDKDRSSFTSQEEYWEWARKYLKCRLDLKKKPKQKVQIEPIYDEVYFEGVEWLDKL